MKFTIEVSEDHDEMFNPRECHDNLGVMLCFHKRYILGDKNRIGIEHEDFSSWEEMEEYLYENQDAVMVMPLYLYDHSGITMSTGDFGDRFDSGQVGFIYATREDVLKAFGHKRNLTKKLMDKVISCLKCEVETYDKYLRGDVWSFSVTDAEGEIVESCGGFYGENEAREEAASVLAHLVKKAA